MTSLELLMKKLPFKYVALIIDNVQHKQLLNEEAYNVIDELMTLFDWTHSREGYDFWYELTTVVSEGGPLPEPPMSIIYAPDTLFITKDEVISMNVGGSMMDARFGYSLKNIKKLDDQKTKEKFYSIMN